MKLKYYILAGYTISMLLTILAVVWAVNQMLIPEGSTIFIVLTTILVSMIGAVISLILMSQIFRSVERLKAHVRTIPEQRFETIEGIDNPIEFKEFAQALNEMTLKLKASFDSLAESEQEKNLMVAQLSHDIKTPITSIQATVEGMLDGIILEEEREYYLQTIRRQTDRLNHLVEELNFLTLNTVESEGSQIQPVFLDKLLLDTLSEFQLQLDQEKREVDISVQPLSARIVSDYDKLLRILVNLVSNALKYSPEGSSLRIEAKLLEDQLTVTVIDEGQGIPEEELEHIFKLLYRVESSRNMDTGGYGLGLYIAQELAHQLGGKISVKSQYGKGSAFCLQLRQNPAR